MMNRNLSPDDESHGPSAYSLLVEYLKELGGEKTIVLVPDNARPPAVRSAIRSPVQNEGHQTARWSPVGRGGKSLSERTLPSPRRRQSLGEDDLFDQYVTHKQSQWTRWIAERKSLDSVEGMTQSAHRIGACSLATDDGTDSTPTSFAGYSELEAPSVKPSRSCQVPSMSRVTDQLSSNSKWDHNSPKTDCSCHQKALLPPAT